MQLISSKYILGIEKLVLCEINVQEEEKIKEEYINNFLALLHSNIFDPKFDRFSLLKTLNNVIIY